MLIITLLAFAILMIRCRCCQLLSAAEPYAAITAFFAIAALRHAYAIYAAAFYVALMLTPLAFAIASARRFFRRLCHAAAVFYDAADLLLRVMPALLPPYAIFRFIFSSCRRHCYRRVITLRHYAKDADARYYWRYALRSLIRYCYCMI